MTTKKILAALALTLAVTTHAWGSNGSKWVPVVTPSFWECWYAQAGLDMTLQNPYGKNFSETFPKGKVFGLNAAVGKWFTPGLNLRAKLMWDNGIVKSRHLEWMAPFGRNTTNHDKGGMLSLYIEAHICPTNMIMGYDERRHWDIEGYARTGLIHNFAMRDPSPVIGIGVVNTYRLNPRLSLFFDMAYNWTTSEYADGSTWSGGGKNGNANGFADFSLGVQFNLGKSGFRKP